MPHSDRGISAVILTFNSARTINRTLDAVLELAGEVHVVDSFSKDDTVEICRARGCLVTQRPFSNYADQRNWAIDNLSFAFPWQLHVDADEELTPDLVAKIAALDLTGSGYDGWIVGRKLVFMGRTLRFGSIAKTWHYRLFRTGFGRCEERLYDQHFVPLGRTGRIEAFMLHHQDMSLSEWTARHNRWSDMETAEITAGEKAVAHGQVQGRIAGNPIEQKRYLKSRYYRLPLFFRSIAYFLYRYVLRLGFLDGREGLIYHMLQGFWFRFLTDAKIYERQLGAR